MLEGNSSAVGRMPPLSVVHLFQVDLTPDTDHGESEERGM